MYNPLRYIDPSGWVISRPERNGILPPPDGSDFDNYVPGRITSDGFSTEHNAYTYSYNMHEVTVTASRYTWAEQWCRDYTWNRRGQYSSEYSGGEVYISPTTSSGGGGGIGMGANNQFGNSKLTPSVVNNVVTGAGTITGYQKSLWEKPKSRTQKAINQKKAYETQKALKQKGITKSVKEIKATNGAKLAKYSRCCSLLGVGLEVVDIGINHQLSTSNVVNGVVAVVSIWVAPVGIVYFGVELGSWIFTGNTFSEHIDNWCKEPLYEW